MRASGLAAVYLGVTLLPLALAWLGARPARSFWDEMASGAGLLAFAVILAEFVLSGRFKSVSGRIGMDVTMRMHQLLARTALVLALLHPFLYRAPFARPLPWDTTRRLTLAYDIEGLASGLLAWVLLPLLVLFGIGRDKTRVRYETWRLMHGAGAAILAGAALHHVLRVGRYSADPILAGFWAVLFALALLSLAFVYVVKPIAQSRRPWTVRAVRPIALRTWELTLAPDGHAGLAYEAGQFAWLNVGHSPFSLNENPFSISSAPAAGPDLQFVIKELGDFTRSLGQIAPGTRAFVDGPHGNLVVAGRSEPGIALIAGGVGIAPLLGILRGLRRAGDRRPTILVYGNRVAEQIVYGGELESLAREHGTKVVHVLSEPAEAWTGNVGMVEAPLIQELFGGPETREWLFVLCGPPQMMEGVEKCLIGLGIPPRRILSERFKYE